MNQYIKPQVKTPSELACYMAKTIKPHCCNKKHQNTQHVTTLEGKDSELLLQTISHHVTVQHHTVVQKPSSTKPAGRPTTNHNNTASKGVL